MSRSNRALCFYFIFKMVNISCDFLSNRKVQEQQQKNGPSSHHSSNMCWHLKTVQEWDYSWLEHKNSTKMYKWKVKVFLHTLVPSPQCDHYEQFPMIWSQNILCLLPAHTHLYYILSKKFTQKESYYECHSSSYLFYLYAKNFPYKHS